MGGSQDPLSPEAEELDLVGWRLSLSFEPRYTVDYSPGDSIESPGFYGRKRDLTGVQVDYCGVLYERMCGGFPSPDHDKQVTELRSWVPSPAFMSTSDGSISTFAGSSLVPLKQ